MSLSNTTFVSHRPRAGLSLLEVLIACGILVVGLSGIAALLPAAGMRFAQATIEDRAGTAAANARADVLSRGLAAFDLFAVAGKSSVFGQVATALSSGTATTWQQALAVAAPAVLGTRIDATRGFALEDDLVFRSGTAVTPTNLFLVTTSGTGPREWKEGICWGATLTPDAYPAARGQRATLSIAVFKKAGQSRQLPLSGSTGPFMMRYTTGAANGVADEAACKVYLAGCSHVLALPANPATTPPAWVKVQSSWTNPGPFTGGIEAVEQRASYCVLAWGSVDPGQYVAGNAVTVMGFEGLVRVDQYSVMLE